MIVFIFLVGFILSIYGSQAQSQEVLKPAKISMPEGSKGIGFDDLTFSQRLNKVIVPSGTTGRINLVDPLSNEITSIHAFHFSNQYEGGHNSGVTSAEEGAGFLFASNRTEKSVHVIDPSSQSIIFSQKLGGDPDYVRFVASINEVWVTEPSAEQIEVFSFNGSSHVLEYLLSIKVPGGPESLVIDEHRQRAYTNQWSENTMVIDLKKHTVISKWFNSCKGSRGIALDQKRGFLLVGCAEGKAVVLDLNRKGNVLSNLIAFAGIDVISYNSLLHHLYLPGSKSGAMAIAGVSAEGRLSLLRSFHIPAGGHCVVNNEKNIWICDPRHGVLLKYNE